MILTVTLNPSVDISYKLETLSINDVNRVSDASKTAGGKGLNVSRVIRQLDGEVVACGFLGGSLGNFIRKELEVYTIKDSFVEIEKDTRNCIAIIHEGKQTEILESGPEINKQEEKTFIQVFETALKNVEIITISGSLPKGVNTDFYKSLIEIAGKHGKQVLLDTNGKTLGNTLKNEVKPYLIKPNQSEIAELLNVPDLSTTKLIEELQSPIFQDISWVVVTMGDKGAIVKYNQNLYKVTPPKIDAINPVGSGDSVIAGFAVGLSKGLEDESLIKYGLTMGVLNAGEEQTGFVNVDKIDWCMNEMIVEKLI